jgi:phosphatidylglycerol---prolipoprotein diacylglyceryl transferase
VIAAIPFPAIDPVAVEIGPIAIRWYALAYIAGILLGWRYLLQFNRWHPVMERRDIDDFLLWATLGIILGGRLGFVLFYAPGYYVANPSEILFVWQGGMSFHGGLLGVVLAVAIFARRRQIELLPLADMVACAAPIGLFFGRIANFINGELYGRVTDVPWAVVFPHAGPEPRHPSQLYEATLEGLLLFLLLLILARRPAVRARPGMLAGVFFFGYGAARTFVELFREPDGFLGGLTMGQALSVPMVLAGLGLIGLALRRSAADTAGT